MSRGGIFAKSDKSKMSVIPEKLIRPKNSSKIKANLEKQDTASALGSKRMQADSPFNDIHNLQRSCLAVYHIRERFVFQSMPLEFEKGLRIRATIFVLQKDY